MAVKLFGIKRDIVGDDDHLRITAVVGIEAQRAAAAHDHHADIAVLDAIDGKCLFDGTGHLLLGHGDGQEDGVGRAPEPIEVGLHAEDLAAIAADALENPVAVQRTVIVDADLGILLA